MLIGVKLRGKDYDVDVTDRLDYAEPVWTWFGLTGDEIAALNVTTSEEDAVTLQVSQALWDRAATANPFED